MRAVREFRWVKGQSRTGDQTFTGNQSYAHMHTYAHKEEKEGEYNVTVQKQRKPHECKQCKPHEWASKVI